ncbi:MAG: chemotaxis response regulator protein-glutamate methylesterase [Deltaproteobacteria bacterium]|nr:chemotaxis response regulator protein-glutamate methylesterase [Deltaproteobacteria bacterium]
MTKKIRVLIVDDSLFMRAAITKTLSTPAFEVVGQAKDGKEALAQIAKLKPDVITMDFNMPGMNGADTVREVMKQKPTPVVMFSAHTKQGAKETFDALAAGAVDFVTKPAGEVSVDLSKIAEDLIQKLTVAASARPRAATAIAPVRNSGTLSTQKTPLPLGAPRLCVVAVSTGGPAALSEVVPALPGELKIAVVIVQHMPAGFTAALAERLDAASRVSVREAQTGDRPFPGTVLIAPGDKHLEFDERGFCVLTDGPMVNGCRPAADVTMMSAAKIYERRSLAVVMTGMGKDGAAGALAIKRVGGKTLAQDAATSVIYGMPKAAVDAGAIDEVCALSDIAAWMRYA